MRKIIITLFAVLPCLLFGQSQNVPTYEELDKTLDSSLGETATVKKVKPIKKVRPTKKLKRVNKNKKKIIKNKKNKKVGVAK